MKENIKSIIRTIGGIIGVATSVFFLTFIVLAWTGPSSTPPTCPEGEVGCEEVLHTGVTAQSKTGGLLLNTGGAEYGLIVENGNVGIGTMNPQSALQVVGGIQIADDITICTSTKAGTLRWQDGSLNICNGSNWQTLYTSPLEATGGIVTTYDYAGTTYNVHTFTSSGTFNVTKKGTLDVLVVGGGGGGGYRHGAGGGAGGLIWTESVQASIGSYSVVVGNGGAGGNSVHKAGNKGESSSINISGIETAIGGGGGDSHDASAGSNGDGGSGGGKAEGKTGPGSGIIGQGYDGGNCISSGYYNHGGGGGAGAVGGTGTNSACGNGGIGINDFVDGNSSATTAFLEAANAGIVSGMSRYLAGGGGGGSHNPAGSASSGGLGGGGAGGKPGSYDNGDNGIPNTGGGGGGASTATGGSNIGGSGGSGIVIIRYPI